MTHYLIVPGLGNSGPEHWQTWLENSGNNFERIQQDEWEAPVCEDWIANIDKAVSRYDPSTVVLVAHSLGCTAVVYWALIYKKIIKGALLVAPSDPESPLYTFPTKGFEKVPLEKINFPTIVVASADDQWVSLERAKFFSYSWNSEFVNIGNAGHINAASGHGPWEEGRSLLNKFD